MLFDLQKIWNVFARNVWVWSHLNLRGTPLLEMYRCMTICLLLLDCRHLYLVRLVEASQNLIVLPHWVRQPVPFGMKNCFLELVLNFYFAPCIVCSFVPSAQLCDRCAETRHVCSDPTWLPIPDVWDENSPVSFVGVLSGLRSFHQRGGSLLKHGGDFVHWISIGHMKLWWHPSLASWQGLSVGANFCPSWWRRRWMGLFALL